MNAIEFIKDHGVDKAREVVEGAPEWATNFNSQIGYTKASNGGEYTVYENQRTGSEDYSLHHEMGVDLSCLNRFVESLDLIKLIGGIEASKGLVDIGDSTFTLSHIAHEGVIYSKNEIKKAIADYEQIFGESK